MSSSPPSVLMVWPHSSVAAALAEAFRHKGYRVQTLNEEAGATAAPESWTRETLSARFAEVGGFTHIVFDLPRTDESSLGEGQRLDAQTLQALSQETQGFLRLIRDLVKLQVFSEQGRFWTLESDDFFRSYFPIPMTPMASGMRISCFRSLCKEFSRFRLQFNNIVFQPPVEMVPATEYRSALPQMKVFSLKFRLPSLADLTETLLGQMEAPGLHRNGTVVHLGIGPNGSNT